MGNDKKMARIVPTVIYLFTSLFFIFIFIFQCYGFFNRWNEWFVRVGRRWRQKVTCSADDY